MVRILSIIALLCLTTYTYGRVERTLSGDSTARNLTMVSDSATEDVRVGRTLSTLKKCPKQVERFMRKEKNKFGNTRCEASDTVSLEDCKVRHRKLITGKGGPTLRIFDPVRKTDNWYVCCWACYIWEQCGYWDWFENGGNRKGSCSLYNIQAYAIEEDIDRQMYAGTTRCRKDSGELTDNCGL